MRLNKTSILGAMGAVALAAASLAGQANAADIVTVNTTDDVYGAFSGAIDSAATGVGAALTWRSAGYYWGGNIELTNAAGITLFEVETNFDDIYNLYAPASGNAHIGEACVADADTGCIVVQSGVAVSLFNVINTLNGGANGEGPAICCGGSDILVTVANAGGGVPEPAAWAMMLVGFGGIGATLRRARRTQAAVAA